MAFLLNRVPPARFECLYALMKFINAKFPGCNEKFRLGDVMFNRDDINIHSFCSQIKSIGDFTYCPYKQNELDESGCGLTNGVYADSTKEKEVGNSVNALHALGFVERGLKTSVITPFGKQFANLPYNSEEMHQIIKKSVLNYGPVIGVINQIRRITNVGGLFKTSEIKVGYPNTKETVVFNNRNISLSVGSKTDSNTRTRSCILAWLTAAGYIQPFSLQRLSPNEYPHIAYRDYLNDIHNERSYIFVEDPIPSLESQKYEIARPLNFSNLTKLTRALRENKQDEVREATMKYEKRVNNRRFAILYFLNKAYKNGNPLKLDNLLGFFHLHKDFFVISDRDLNDIVKEELDIANMGGVPFEIIEDNGSLYLSPYIGVSEDELCSDANPDLMVILRNTNL